MGCWNDVKAELIQQSFNSLRPGGWLESQEIESLVKCDDGTLAPDSSLISWARNLSLGGAKIGRPRDVSAEQMAQWYREVGFVDVKVVPFKIPIGCWAGTEEVGVFWLLVMRMSVEGLSLRLLHETLGFSEDDTKV